MFWKYKEGDGNRKRRNIIYLYREGRKENREDERKYERREEIEREN